MDIGPAQQADLLRRLTKAVHHGCRNLVRRVDAGELIGIGKEIAFQRLRLRIDLVQQGHIALGRGDEVRGRAQSGLFDHGRDVIQVVALGHDDGAGKDVAAQHTVSHLQRIRRNIELVLACLEASLTHRVVKQQKCRRAAYDSFPLQRLGDVTGAPSRTQAERTSSRPD